MHVTIGSYMHSYCKQVMKIVSFTKQAASHPVHMMEYLHAQIEDCL